MAAGARQQTALPLPGWIAVIFGVLTLVSGGMALFGPDAVQAGLGDTVGFVLWFNFLAGFAYVAAGSGLLCRKRWAVWLSAGIAGATVAVFAAFALHILSGAAYEVRTVLAMSFRCAVWLAITAIAVRKTGWT